MELLGVNTNNSFKLSTYLEESFCSHSQLLLLGLISLINHTCPPIDAMIESIINTRFDLKLDTTSMSSLSSLE